MDTATAARLLADYAKGYGAGAFATPLARELSPGNLHLWPGAVGVGTTLTRPGRRRDFTGQTLVIPAGTKVLGHLALEPGAEVPDVSGWDLVRTYREDRELTKGLEAQGREVVAVQITAAAELLAWWGRAGQGSPYSPAERATLVSLPLELSPGLRSAVLEEVNELDGWGDLHPYYHSGEWSSLSLRGYRPDDPTWDLKPAEMQRSWQAAHPEAAGYVCDWTTLMGRCPALTELTLAMADGASMDRVRLLRLTTGTLRRHTDITDRSFGMRDGSLARLHLPLVTTPGVTMTCWDLEGNPITRELAAWDLHYLDARKPHAVTNPTAAARIHLVVDVVADELLRRRITHQERSAA